MNGIEPLTWFVENQQARIFNEGACQENQSLETSRKGKEWVAGEVKQLELF
jgi:hypothetical protein